MLPTRWRSPTCGWLQRLLLVASSAFISATLAADTFGADKAEANRRLEAECVDFNANASAATGGYDCAVLSSYGYCDSLLCSACSGAGLCDASCGFCETDTPTIAPSEACLDFDDNVSAVTGGYDCSALASFGYCDSYFCLNCSLAGLCDASCGYCTSTQSTFEAMPTVAPSAAPSIRCADDDTTMTGMFGADCATAAAMGYCESYLCTNCSFAGLCDAACGYCVAANPTIAPSVGAESIPIATPTAALSTCADDDDTATTSVGYSCSVLASAGYCGYMCPDCSYAGMCDVSCGYCPTPVPTPAPCVDDDDTATTSVGYSCSILSSAGYCGYMCPDCSYAGMCDVSCGYCPTPVPTPAPCMDDDDTATTSVGYSCSILASAGYCGYMCPECEYAGLCDVTCGYCPASSSATANPTAVPTAQPTTSVPTPVPSQQPTRTPMVTMSVNMAGGLDCSSYGVTEEAVLNAALGDILSGASFGSHVCIVSSRRTTRSRRLTNSVVVSMEVTVPTDSLADDGGDALGSVTSSMNSAISSGLLASSVSSHAAAAGSTVMASVAVQSVSVDTFVPSPAPSASPTATPTSMPTGTPTPSPTLSGAYDISTYSELSDAIASAEDGREWVLTVMNDLVANHTLDISHGHKNVKLIGSASLGRRIRIGSDRCVPNQVDESCHYFFTLGHNIEDADFSHITDTATLHLENLEINGFSSGVNGVVFQQKIRCTMTVYNCRFANNRATPLYISGPNVIASVRGSEFFDNSSPSAYGCGGIAIATFSSESTWGNNTLEVADTVFARNTAAFGAAIYVAGAHPTTLVRNCSAYDNQAGSSGGAVSMRGYGTIRGSVFRNNTSGYGGGVAYTGGDEGRLEISNTVFADNLAVGTTGGGAIAVGGLSDDAHVLIANSKFQGNKASNGAGGAVLAIDNELDLIESNFTANFAATDGGAVHSEGRRAIVYPRGATRFIGNIANENGGAVSLDGSSLRTNEGALVFAENEARRGGALATVNEAAVLISAGCQTTTFELNWASSSSSSYPQVVVRRSREITSVADQPTVTPAPTAVPTISSTEMIDERDEWMILSPSVKEDTNISFCLAPGEYEIRGTQPGCYGGWGGGFVRVVDLKGEELLTRFTLREGENYVDGSSDGCTAATALVVPRDTALTEHQGPVLFDRNRATGTSGCGGALFVGESCTVELDRVDFTLNSASDGGALFVDFQGNLLLSRSSLRSNNAASGDGGAMSARDLATVSISQTVAKHNIADGSGGALHLAGVLGATLRGIGATGNKAGASGGALAVVDSSRTAITMTNSTVYYNQAAESGGGIFLESSEMKVTGVQLLENTAEHNHGGAVAATGANLEFSDTECTPVDILLDWTAAGNGCPLVYANIATCASLAGYYALSCADAQSLGQSMNYWNDDPSTDFDDRDDPCSGCPCNILRDEKYFVIQGATSSGEETFDIMDAASVAVDFSGTPMRGTPFAGSVRRFSFCALPGEYTMHAVDLAGDGWWGGAFYSVLVNGDTVVRDEMNRTSATTQSNAFTVNLPASARTSFSKNRASQGGGGAVFWRENVPPENLENYRGTSDLNVALYGDYVATPARTLSASNHTYDAVSGISMATAPITVELKDSYDQLVRSANNELVYARANTTGGAQLVNPSCIISEGSCEFGALEVKTNLGTYLSLELVHVLTGRSAPVRVHVAEDCPPGYWAEYPGVKGGNAVCTACKERYYERGGECFECEPGMRCEVSGLTIRDVRLEPGYWRIDEYSRDVRKCPFDDTSCPGDDTNHSTSAPNNRYCAANHVGHLCSACADGFFLSWIGDGKCHHCVSGERHAPTIGLYTGVVLFVMIGLACVCKKAQRKAKESVKDTALPSPLRLKAERVYFLAKFKVFTMFLTSQVISEFATISKGTGTGEEYPEPARTFVRVLGVTNFDFFGFVPLGCIVRETNFCHKCLLKVIAPPIVIALIWCYPMVMALRGVPSTATNSAKKLTLLLLELVLPNIVTSLIQVLICERFDDGSFLSADLSISCDGGDQRMRWVVFATLSLVIYLLGVPTLVFATLYSNRHNIRKLGTDLAQLNRGRGTRQTARQFAKSRHARSSFTALTSEMAWLLPKFEKYSPSFWFAGVGLLLLRLVQTSLMALVRTQRVQAALVCIFTLIGLSLVVEFSPMRLASDNRVVVLSQALIYLWVFVLLLRLGGIFVRPTAAVVVGTVLCISTVGVFVSAFVLANNDRRAEDLTERADRSAAEPMVCTDEMTTSFAEEGGGGQQQESTCDADDAALRPVVQQGCSSPQDEHGSKLEEESKSAPSEPEEEDASSPSAWLARVVGGNLCLEDQRNADEAL